MRVSKDKNYIKYYDITLREDNKELKIIYGCDLDLYLTLSDGRLIPENESTKKYFDITKENYQVYCAFDKLYKNIIKGNPLGEETSYIYKNYRYSNEYSKLVNNNNIVWLSDEDIEEKADSLTITKKDEDTYRLLFTRSKEPLAEGKKSSFNISVKIGNISSRYNPFNNAFMNMFNDLQDVNTECHQMHIEEVEYIKKLQKKR